MVNNIIKNNIKFWAGLLFAQFLIFYLVSKTSIGIHLAELLFEFKKQHQQNLSSLLSISLGDVLYSILLIYILFCVTKLFFEKSRKRYISKLFVIANIFYFIYQISWGLLYFQTPIIEKLPKKNITENQIRKITLRYINLCNESRKYTQENKDGIFTLKNIDATKKEILRNQFKIPKAFSNKKYTKIDNFKPSLFGKLTSYTGILGYYNPFTTEAQYNSYLPSTYIPFTLAHESAHQIGFAREQEANFIAYLICKNSNNPELEYSVNLYIVKSLLNAQLENNPKFVETSKSLLSAAVKRDLENNKKFAIQHESFMNDFFLYTNDLFLKSNRQEGSITYSYFIELLLRYEN